MMRLTQSEIKQLVLAIAPFLNGQNAELRLYGSRVNDDLKGGDIDLLLIVDHEQFSDALNLQKHRLLSTIKHHLGDRKIDTFIISRDTMMSDVFFTMIFPDSVILHHFQNERRP